MKREYSVIKDPRVGVPGDENAVAVGMALANRFDAQTLRLIHDTFTAMELIGGQLAIVAHREKYDDWGNKLDRKEQNEVPGQWRTDAYIFHYENRDVKVKQLQPVPDGADPADADSFVSDHVMNESGEESVEVVEEPDEA